MGFYLVPLVVTLNDIERCNSPYFAYFTEFGSFGKSVLSKWLKTDL